MKLLLRSRMLYNDFKQNSDVYKLVFLQGNMSRHTTRKPWPIEENELWVKLMRHLSMYLAPNAMGPKLS